MTERDFSGRGRAAPQGTSQADPHWIEGFTPALRRLREAFLETILAKLSKFDPENEGDFATAVEFSSYFGITQTELSQACQVTGGTISRWAKGTSLPLILIRPAIVAKVQELGRAKLGELRRGGRNELRPKGPKSPQPKTSRNIVSAEDTLAALESSLADAPLEE